MHLFDKLLSIFIEAILKKSMFCVVLQPLEHMLILGLLFTLEKQVAHFWRPKHRDENLEILLEIDLGGE